jgi:predicted DCC family thiol-disulfide oxidoreductase YuxK
MSNAQVNTAESADLKVFYDGACPLCRREIDMYKDLKGAESINWVNLQSCDADEIPRDVTRDELLGRFHIQSSDQSVKSGAAAFVEIWQKLPAFRFLARLAKIPGAMPVLEFGYILFLKIRPLMQKGVARITNDKLPHSDTPAN